MKKYRHTNAFTLIELLTVIAIIAVLIGLLFPAIKMALLKAEITKTQAGISGLSTAFRAYYTEYGKWPAIEPDPTKSTILVSSGLIGLLRGQDISAFNDANLPAVSYNGNPRHIVFLEFKSADLVISETTTNFIHP